MWPCGWLKLVTNDDTTIYKAAYHVHEVITRAPYTSNQWFRSVSTELTRCFSAVAELLVCFSKLSDFFLMINVQNMLTSLISDFLTLQLCPCSTQSFERLYIIIIIIRHAPYQCVAPLATNSLHSDLSNQGQLYSILEGKIVQR